MSNKTFSSFAAISLSMVEYLVGIKGKLSMIDKNEFLNKKSKVIENLRISFINARNAVSKLDHSLYLIHFIDSILTIATIMLHICKL
jgi:hypothetical protein